MKNIFKTGLVLFALLSTNCNDKKDDDKIDYYLSQPRDIDLTGWWVRSNGEIDSMFYNFQRETGRFFAVEYDKGSYLEHKFDTYWFTEKSENRNILHQFEKHGGLYGSAEYTRYYKIANDSLWMSDGIGEISGNSDLAFWGVKTIAPQY
jgi:hypothetical protein